MATLVWKRLPFAVVLAYASACAHPNAGNQGQVADTTSHPAQRDPTTVTSVDKRVAPREPIEMALEGKVPGLEVTRTTDGSVAIRIHGPSSFYGSGTPLYVLDGIPITPGPMGRITGLNASDIESIQVLKDPEDTAIYGVRGGNGVIVIKTKTAQAKPKN